MSQADGQGTVTLENELSITIESSKAPAISRAAAVLRLLGKSDSALGVHTIARRLGLVPSTCLHILRALVVEELVSFDADTKRYELDAGVLTLARQWLKRNRFTDLAQPVLDRIAQSFKVTVLGAHLVGLDHMIVVAHSQSTADIQLRTQIGSRFPALISATGRCVAAFGNHSLADLRDKFRNLRWDEPPTFQEWMAQVDQVKAQGFAIDNSRHIAGVTVIAAPVWKTRGKLSHALVVLGLTSNMTRNGLPELEQAIVSAALSLSAQLSGSGPLE